MLEGIHVERDMKPRRESRNAKVLYIKYGVRQTPDSTDGFPNWDVNTLLTVGDRNSSICEIFGPQNVAWFGNLLLRLSHTF
jgi:hypothetical protein